LNPAYSIIFFTSASGAGYGMGFVLGIGVAFGFIDVSAVGVAAVAVTSFVLVTAGLLSSTFHLGHPERAWRALSQIGSSWLSREGVLALVTYLPMLLLVVLALIEGPTSSLELSPFAKASGFFLALGSVATVYATAMIYRSLDAIPKWSTAWVVPNYLLLALATGSVFAVLMLRVTSDDATPIAFFGIVIVALATAGKWLYWRHIDALPSESSVGSATGLGGDGRTVTLLDKPHTGTNYLQQEMGYTIARKHARKLRERFFACGFGLTFLFMLGAGLMVGEPAIACALLAVLAVGVGVVVERWLFFAQAEHKVMLYYGQSDI
jgi:DMSO reductase anchor subunit